MDLFTESLRYDFTPPQLVEIAREQARHYGSLKKAEEEFENVRAAHKSRVTRLEADIADCARRISSGYEMQNTECLALKHRPKPNEVLIVRLDTGAVVRVRSLSVVERQMTINEGEPPTYPYEADFWEAESGGAQSCIARDVLLTEAEAEKLRPVVDVRPAALKLEVGA